MNYRAEFSPFGCLSNLWLDRVAALALVVASICLAGIRIHAASVPPGFTETVVPGPGVGGAWNEVVGVTFSDAGRIFVWERTGRVLFKDPADAGFTQLLDISEEVSNWNDHGMLGFALDPDFLANGNIYLLYTVDRHHLMNFGTGSYNPNSNAYGEATIGRLARYTCTSSNNFRSINPASRFILLGESKTNGIPMISDTHGVGSLVFGQDHTLLVSCGDSASAFVVDPGGAVTASYAVQALADKIITTKENVGAFRAQLVDSLGGKILRIDPVTGDGVPSNPYYDPAKPRAAKSRVWALGTRNPFRMSLRPDSGDHDPAQGKPGSLYIGNVGWNNWESLKVVNGPAQNLGWPLFEGLELTPLVNGETYNIDVLNRDATNALCGGYFSFRQLLKQDSIAVADQPPFNNPCNTSVKIPASIPQFLHKRPVLDWNHFNPTLRTGTYNGSGQATTVNVGAVGSPVTGEGFYGYCAVGGTWFTANTFPTQYVNTYFMADWGVGLIKNVVFTTNDTPVAVRNFVSAAGAVVCIAAHPDGSLYYVAYDENGGGTVRKIAYTGNRTPVAAATSDKTFGPGPLTVQFNGSGSSDPDAQTLTYLWNFGDGTANSTAANPLHTFTPPNANAAPYTVTLTVTDTGGLAASTTIFIVANDTPPQVTITSPVDGSLYSMVSNTPFNLTATVFDAESADGLLAYSWQTFLHHNSHEHLVTSTTNHTGSTVTDPTGCDGVNVLYFRVALTVTDPAGLSTTRDVGVFPDCGSTDTPPTISDIANQAIPVGTATAAIPFTIDDAQVIPANLQLSVTSSNLALVPLSRIILGGSGSSRTVTVTPAPGLNGSSLITITVNDGPNNVSDSFLLTAGTNTPPSTTPTITDIPSQATTIDTPTAAIPFTIADPDTPLASLTLSRNSSDTNLVPTSNIVFGGSSSNRTVTVTPATGLTGTTIITVTVSDGTNSANDTFLLTVTTVNTPPTISGIPSQVVNEDNGTGPVAFTIADAETAAGSLTLGKGSSDLSLVPTSNIVFGGSGSNRTVTVTPATNLSGSATITVTVGDGQYTVGTNFTITVNAVNDAPTITSIANQSIGVSSTAGPLNFTVGDVETAAASLTVSSNSSNPALVPDANIVLGGTGASRTVTVTPVAGQTGTAVITISVSDGALTASNTFNVTVSAQPAGLVAAYSFNEGSGTNVADVSGYINNGVIGAATWTTNGRYSKALTFNGTSARITVNDSPSLDLTTNMTLEAWVYPTTGGGWRDVIYKGANDIYYLMGSSDTGAPAVGGTFAPGPLRGAAALPLNSWTHLAGTYDGTTMRLFTNGVQVVSVAQTGAIQTSTTALTIGGDALYGQYFSGRIDEVRIYNRALDVAEIQADMNTPVGAPLSQPPTITSITNQITTVNTPKTGIAFTISDAQTAASNLVLSATSANTTLVPTNNIVFGGAGANRTVTITPASNQLGSATITLIVSDGSLTASNSFVLTVNPATLTVTENSASRGYGLNNPALTGSVVGLQAGDVITASFTSAATTNSPVGAYPITFTLSDTDNKLGNYIVTTNNGTLTVTNADLLIMVNSMNKVYGVALNPSDFTVTGLLNGDSVTNVNLSSPGSDTNAPVGGYAINASGASGLGLTNYTVGYSNGTLTVTQAVLFATADNKSRAYGQPNPDFTINFIGFVNGEGTNVLDSLPLASTTATNTTAPGNYSITLSGGSDDNYSFSLISGSLSISQPGAIMITNVDLIDPNHLRIAGTGDAQVTYTVEKSADLLTWETLGTAAADVSGAFEYIDATTGAAAQRFYRIVTP